MQVLPRWKVEVDLGDSKPVFHISDNFLSSVLRKISEIEFSVFPEPEPISITISKVEKPELGSYTYTTSPFTVGSFIHQEEIH